MADLARGILIAGVVLAAGGLSFAVLVQRPLAASGQIRVVQVPLLLRYVPLVACVLAATAGLVIAGSGGAEHAGWLLALAAATAGLALTRFAPEPDRSAVAAAWLLAAAGLIGVPALLGNATRHGAWLAVPANTLHVAAAALWLGGIAGLLGVHRATRGAGDQAAVLAQVAMRFSGLALLAVVLLALSGLVEGLVLVRRIDALVTTGYGRVVSIKALLLCGLAGLGALQRGRSLPELVDTVDRNDGSRQATDLLARVLRVEAGLLIAVLLLTGLLAAGRPPVVAGVRVVRASVPLGAGSTAHLALTPAAPGTNRLTIRLRPRQAGALTVTAAQPKLGIAPARQPLARQSDGSYLVQLALPAPGRWRIALVLQRGGGSVRGSLSVRLR